MDYRILTLDGGGSWALIEIAALTRLYGEDRSGHDVLRDFDMVAANSGGSLVLGGLVENLTLKELRGYFADEDKRRSIFSPLNRLDDRVLRDLLGFGPKYSAARKLDTLRRLLPKTGDKRLLDVVQALRGPGGADVHLLIVGFDYDRNRARFFQSALIGADTGWGSGDGLPLTLAQAIHASSNAPINYFDAPAEIPGSSNRYWDGGITGCNNPVLAALTMAVAKGCDPKEVITLSLGTGTVQLPLAAPGATPSAFEAPRSQPGLGGDVGKLARSILDDPPDAASYIAHVMTGNGRNLPDEVVSRIVRMNPVVGPAQDAARNWVSPEGMTEAQFAFLRNIDVDAVEPKEVDAIAQCAALWLDNKLANQPIRSNEVTLQPILGYQSFSAAQRAWTILCGL